MGVHSPAKTGKGSTPFALTEERRAMGYEDAARACQAYIDANLDKELTLESIANALSFSTIYLRKSFKRVSNVTIG